MKRLTLRRSLVALLTALLTLCQVTWALAGTTGGLGGVVMGEDGKPVSGAAVKVASASQTSTTETDSSGHFNFLSLAPDTYTVSIGKEGYNPIAYAGVSVFADNQVALSFRMQKQLKTIANVTSRAAGDVVKSGVGSDIYNVNAKQIDAAAVLGGGANLNNAYSAISSVPGVTVPSGGMGWNQPTYVRGSQSFFTGFEYDGIPVNRSFDNYVASTESNLGLQELQVYTGGGPSSNSSSGTSGFINQVIKTGTYPGYFSLNGGIGTPTFYHQLKIETGGATPDRRFSYYAGLSGYDQSFRYLNNQNGANFMQPGDVRDGYSTASTGTIQNLVFETVAPLCNPGTNVTPSSVSGLSWFQPDLNLISGGSATSNCLITYPNQYGYINGISDRENIFNFHFRIPRKNGQSDDLQLLGSTSELRTSVDSSINDAGGYDAYTLAVTGQPYCAPTQQSNSNPACGTGSSYAPNYPNYVDAVVYNAPFGTPISTLKTQVYYQPSSSDPARGYLAQIPANLRDVQDNDTGVVKLQYTHQLGSNAYIRAFGYTFYSDWMITFPNYAYNGYQEGIGGPTDANSISGAANYDLITHTAGGELQFADQLTSAHLLELTANYTTANVIRFNNSGFTSGPSASPIGIVSDSGGQFSCWDEHPGDSTFDQTVPCVPSGSAFKKWGSHASSGPYNNAAIGPNAAAAGAQWITLWDGNAAGSYNTVKPDFSFVSLGDQWRPNDKLLLNFNLRYENYLYKMPSQASLATQFYAQVEQHDVCVNGSGGVLTQPLLPGQPPPAPVIYTSSCSAGTVVKGYPNGLPAGYSHPNFSANSPPSYTIANVSPRFSATYSQSPDTVWRVSAGRFTEPPISASIQYLNTSGNNLTVWNATLPLGFDSPFHPIPEMTANQFDLSLERHIRGSDVSFKISPFYNLTNDYQEQAFIGPSFVTQAPVGQFRSTGAEFAISKGDFARDGLSGQLSLTYTDAKVQYGAFFGPNSNQLVGVNNVISEFNKLTQAGGGSQCYLAGSPAACSTAGAILNPYYNTALQSPIATNGWYPGGDAGLSATNNPTTTYFDSPWNGTLILNYRKRKFAITPSIQIAEGSSYGGPLDVVGIDPRTCGANSSQNFRPNPSYDPSQPVSPTNMPTVAVTPITTLSPNTNPNQCDALTAPGTFSAAAGQLFIPNPQTGQFAQPGAYRNPWVVVGNLAMSYDLSPRLSASVTVGNLFHTCFGGTKMPWTAAYGPSPSSCGYTPNPLYVSNFYNGTSPYDAAANGTTPYPWQVQSYIPSRSGSDAGGIPSPLNVFFSLNVKM